MIIHKGKKMLASPCWPNECQWFFWGSELTWQKSSLFCWIAWSYQPKYPKGAVCSSHSHLVLSSAYKAFFTQREACWITGLLCQKLILGFWGRCYDHNAYQQPGGSPLSMNSWFICRGTEWNNLYKALSKIISQKFEMGEKSALFLRLAHRGGPQ